MAFWTLENTTPMGSHNAQVSPKDENLTHAFTNRCGTCPIAGSLSRETASWPVKFNAPFPMELRFTITAGGHVDGTR